jgi:hypothetical protein
LNWFKLDGCSDADPTGLAGKIALIIRGTCNFQPKAEFAHRGGAVAVIIYNNLVRTILILLSLHCTIGMAVPGYFFGLPLAESDFLFYILRSNGTGGWHTIDGW